MFGLSRIERFSSEIIDAEIGNHFFIVGMKPNGSLLVAYVQETSTLRSYEFEIGDNRILTQPSSRHTGTHKDDSAYPLIIAQKGVLDTHAIVFSNNRSTEDIAEKVRMHVQPLTQSVVQHSNLVPNIIDKLEYTDFPIGINSTLVAGLIVPGIVSLALGRLYHGEAVLPEIELNYATVSLRRGSGVILSATTGGYSELQMQGELKRIPIPSNENKELLSAIHRASEVRLERMLYANRDNTLNVALAESDSKKSRFGVVNSRTYLSRDS